MEISISGLVVVTRQNKTVCTSDYVNEWDQPVTYQCPNDGFITGIDSVHDNRYEDRRFKYQCCEVAGRPT